MLLKRIKYVLNPYKFDKKILGILKSWNGNFVPRELTAVWKVSIFFYLCNMYLLCISCIVPFIRNNFSLFAFTQYRRIYGVLNLFWSASKVLNLCLQTIDYKIYKHLKSSVEKLCLVRLLHGVRKENKFIILLNSYECSYNLNLVLRSSHNRSISVL